MANPLVSPPSAALPFHAPTLVPSVTYLGSSSSSFSSSSSALPDLDVYALVMKAGQLVSSRSSDGALSSSNLEAWKDLSDRGVAFLRLVNTTAVGVALTSPLVRLLDAIAKADLHPSQRATLAFPRAFRKEIASDKDALKLLSNDELCIAWSALDRFQLMDKQTSLNFFQVATAVDEAGGMQRCSQFSLRNWLHAGMGLREFTKFHPTHKDFHESVLLRLLVEEQDRLARRGLQLEALQVVTRMARLNSRQIHRITALVMGILPELSPSELVTVPRLCAAGAIQDEALFGSVVDHLGTTWNVVDLRDLVLLWRGLLKWRVGLPGLQRMAAVEVSEALARDWSRKRPPASAVVRQLRALGRLDEMSLRGPKQQGYSLQSLGAFPEVGAEEADSGLQPGQRAAARALVACLDALPAASRSLAAADLLLALNAMGQVARAWSWLETATIPLLSLDDPGSLAYGANDGEDGEEAALAYLKEAAASEESTGSFAPDVVEQISCLEKLADGADVLSEALFWHLKMLDSSPMMVTTANAAMDASRLSPRDLALLNLGFGRLLRRGVPLKIESLQLSQDLCNRLSKEAKRCAQATEDASSEDLMATASASISSASTLVMQAARCEHFGDSVLADETSLGRAWRGLAEAALACLSSWTRSLASVASSEGRPTTKDELHKAVAAVASLRSHLAELDARGEGLALDGGLTGHCEAVLEDLLHEVFEVSPDARPASDPSEQEKASVADDDLRESLVGRAEALEAWHLDGGLVGLSWCPHTSSGPLAVLEEVLIEEACCRQSLLLERHLRYWSSRFNPSSSLPRRLVGELQRLENEDPKMDAVASSALRDMAFLFSEETSPTSQ